MMLSSCFSVSFHIGSHTIILESILFLDSMMVLTPSQTLPRDAHRLLSCKYWCSLSFLHEWPWNTTTQIFLFCFIGYPEHLLLPQHLNHYLGIENSCVRLPETWCAESDLTIQLPAGYFQELQLSELWTALSSFSVAFTSSWLLFLGSLSWFIPKCIKCWGYECLHLSL